MAEKMSKKELKEARRVEEMKKANMEKKASMTKWVSIGVIAALFLGFFAFLVVTLKNDNPNISGNGENSTVELSDSGKYRTAEGAVDSDQNRPVVLTEFADIQCPACQSYHPVVKNVLELYPDNVVLNFKHFPLESIHQHAVPAAVAAEAAGNQDMFFEMVDLLYERQQAWSSLPNPRDKFIEYAEELNLDVEQFTADLDDPALEERVQSQKDEATNAGANSTPTFFVNGEKIKNPSGIEEFQSIIDEALQEAGVSSDASQAEEASPSADNQQNTAPQQLDL